MRDLVLVEELADDRQVRIAQRSDDAHPDEAGTLQQDPARLERLEQLVAEIGDLVNHPAQVAGPDTVGPASPLGVGRDDGRAIGQQRDVARELAWTVDNDRPRLVARFVHDRDRARLDDVEGEAALPGPEQGLAVSERTEVGHAGQGFNLGLIKAWEREVMFMVNVSHRPDLHSLDPAPQPPRREQACDRRSIPGRPSIPAPLSGLEGSVEVERCADQGQVGGCRAGHTDPRRGRGRGDEAEGWQPSPGR